MPNLGHCKCCGDKVSSEAASCPHCGQPEPYDDKWKYVAELLQQGDKVNAVKYVRESTGLGIREAINFVEKNFTRTS